MPIRTTPPFDSVLFAEYIAAYANDNGYWVNVTKIQKLLYISYGIYLAVRRERLVDEHPQAWPYGPVFPQTRLALMNANILGFRTTDEQFAILNADTDIRDLLQLVFDTFGNWSASQLSEWSHQDGSPWHEVVSSLNSPWGREIPDTSIAPYFDNILTYGGE